MIRIEDLALSILTKTTVIPEFKSKDGDLNVHKKNRPYCAMIRALTNFLPQNLVIPKK